MHIMKVIYIPAVKNKLTELSYQKKKTKKKPVFVILVDYDKQYISAI